jgi:hypothetical protein
MPRSVGVAPSGVRERYRGSLDEDELRHGVTSVIEDRRTSLRGGLEHIAVNWSDGPRER